MFLCIIPILLIIIVYIVYRKKNKEGFKDSETCKQNYDTKEFAKHIIESLKNDLQRIHPTIGEYTLKFYPLECCKLEDSETEDKKKVYICVKNKNGEYYNYNKLLQVAIHELAHAMSKSKDPDHTGGEFNSNYSNLMNKAQSLKLIDVSRLNKDLM